MERNISCEEQCTSLLRAWLSADRCDGAILVSLPLLMFRCRHAQDPLGLGKTDSSLERFTEAELMNGRWAMLGVAGALAPEVLGFGDWWSAPLWVSNKPLTWRGNIGTVLSCAGTHPGAEHSSPLLCIETWPTS